MNINHDVNELAVIKAKVDNDLLFFTRYFFKKNKNQKFICNNHHRIICNDLQALENYEIEVLNINIPPRFSKTELAAVNFIARGIGLNPSANYLYITASDELRAQTSVEIRNLINSEAYQQLYNIELRKDQNAKNLWRTKQGGGLKTATIFGQITGFGAGQMIENPDLINYIRDFEGCIILDDINKMDDSEIHNAISERVNRIIGNTILSRKNSKDTPIINIQQRAGTDDATAYLKEHFQNNPKLKNLVLPVKDENGVPLWAWKLGIAEIKELETSRKTKHSFFAQYMQDPRLDTESLFFIEHEDYKIIDSIPKDAKRIPYGSDIGFSPDPTVLYELFNKGNDIYINELFYLNNLCNVDPNGDLTNGKTIDFQYKKYNVGSNIIVSDIDFVMITELRMKNWMLMPAIKGPGSVERGIKKMKSFNLFITKNSTELIEELKGYKRLKDPLTGLYLPKPDPRVRKKHGIDACRYAIDSQNRYW